MMSRPSPHAVAPLLACAGALFLASGCLVGVNVGEDGHGGSAATTTSSAGAGAAPSAPTGLSCNSPSALLCAWGKGSGPCGGNLPYKKDCDDGLVCVGATADTEGTCLFPGESLLGPGDPCNTEDSLSACPWNAGCDTTPPMTTGTCSAKPNCTLDISQPVVSAASLTVDGDGPTQHYDFACPFQYGDDLTGEANASLDSDTSNTSVAFINIHGCVSESGDVSRGTINILARFYSPSGPAMVGGTTDGDVTYFSPWINGASAGEFMSSNPNLPDSPGSVSISFEEIGADTVRGSYDAVLPNLDGSDTRHLTGTFAVCRLPDRITH